MAKRKRTKGQTTIYKTLHIRISLRQIDRTILMDLLENFTISSFIYRVCNWSNTTGVVSGAGTTSYPSGAHEFTPGFSGVRSRNKWYIQLSFLIIFTLTIILK
jgi:hypothetical protein